ncbi:MAG TPA: hypothetical protein VFK85_08135, partial [Anaeromyxobacteraceae bacterium]|nr:hypothetical protein [Anaeromyxobacteraceae bacterium]
MITGWKRALQGASEPAPSRWRQVLLPLAGATALAVGAAAAIGVATLIGVPHAAATTAAPPVPPRPERPTVRGDVDERIERHCGALMGRECTAEEKRRFPKFLLDS